MTPKETEVNGNRFRECQKCGCKHFEVLYTRWSKKGVRRRRECRHCKHRKTTIEADA